MVKVSDCGCCDCDSKQEKEQIKERALNSVNKIYTFDARTYWPDGTGMVTIPLPTQDQLNKIEEVGTLADQVAKNTIDIGTNAELIAGEQTQIDSLKTTLETSYQAIVQKGNANGYAGLDNNARVPLAQLYTGTSANQVPVIGKQLLANEMLVVDADGHTIRSKPLTQTLSFRGIYASKSALPSEGNVSGDYAVVSDGTAQADTGYYVWGFNTATSEYEWVWTILFDANNYQLISNLQTAIGSDADDSHYPSSKATKDYVDAVAGALQQDVDALETDMAAAQTAIGEHTTGISNAITQAQEGYQSASVDGSNLVLTKGNGSSDSVALPSGEWEELDTSNLPNDFASGNEMFFVCGITVNIEADNWNSNINTFTLAATNTPKTAYIAGFFTLADKDVSGIPVYTAINRRSTSSQIITNAVYTIVYNIENRSYWNNRYYNTTLFKLKGIANNATEAYESNELYLSRNSSLTGLQLFRRKK